MDIHDLAPEGRVRALDVDCPPHILEFLHRSTIPITLALKPDKRLVDKRPDLLRGCVLADDVQQLERVRLVCCADHPEQIVEHVAVVVQFLGGAFLGDAAPLVEGFVEDADAVEGAAVVAGGDAGALSITSSISLA
jgi:hypothetical protein